ncbi:MAG TPA: hypothetical protein EYM99_13275 [Alphaproteobacteria bacterium]|nr:hypothetical protein [Alphaproteobacteria bacterium]
MLRKCFAASTSAAAYHVILPESEPGRQCFIRTERVYIMEKVNSMGLAGNRVARSVTAPSSRITVSVSPSASCRLVEVAWAPSQPHPETVMLPPRLVVGDQRVKGNPLKQEAKMPIKNSFDR